MQFRRVKNYDQINQILCRYHHCNYNVKLKNGTRVLFSEFRSSPQRGSDTNHCQEGDLKNQPVFFIAHCPPGLLLWLSSAQLSWVRREAQFVLVFHLPAFILQCSHSCGTSIEGGIWFSRGLNRIDLYAFLKSPLMLVAIIIPGIEQPLPSTRNTLMLHE